MNKSTLLTAFIMLGVGLGAGYLLSPTNENSISPSQSEGKAPAQKPLFYRNAMNPSVTSPTPAKDAMGMDYIPIFASTSKTKEKPGTVEIDPVVVQNIGVRTAIAKQKSISRTIRAVGLVAFDEERIARLHPKVEGWINKIIVDKTGQVVKTEDILASIYSPLLVSTQQEYLLALNNLNALEKSQFEDIKNGAKELVKSSRERLQLLDVPEHQIVKLEKTRKITKTLHIVTPVDGTIIKIGARQGQFVTPRTELYMVVDLNHVWVYADVYEYELPWVKMGDTVDMTLASVPGKVFKGTVGYIYPYAEAKTRTTKVRLSFDNHDQLLRPDMFSEVTIHSGIETNAVVIPSESVIRSGSRTQVFVVRGPGKFEPRVISVGIDTNGEVEVLKGLKAGEEVVSSAQFMIDSESSLRESTAKMLEVLNREKKSNTKEKAKVNKENTP